MRKPLRFAYAKLGARYPRLLLTGQFLLTHLVTLGGVGLLTLYQRMSDAHFWTVVLVSQLLVVIENVLSVTLAFKLLRPADPWLRGERNAETATAAWRALAGLPVDFIRNRRAFAVFMNIVPISAFITILLGLPAYAFLVLPA